MTALSTLADRRHELLKVRGSARERGRVYGRHYRELLPRLVSLHLEHHAVVRATPKDEVLERARQYRRNTEAFSTEIGDELRGAAEAAGVGTDEIYVLAAFCELLYPDSPHERSAPRHCTSFAARNGATRDGLTYVGQTDDDSIGPWLNGDAVTLVRYESPGSPRVLVYSYAGVPAQMGLNSAGLAVGVNAIPFDRAADGVPMWCLVREVLNRTRVEDAIELIRETKRAYALNFVLADPREIADVEATPVSVDEMRPDDLLYHSNHCVTRAGAAAVAGTNSRLRLERIAELMEGARGRLDRETLQTFLRDHHRRPDSICSHAGEDPRAPDNRTFDAMIYVLERREAWLTRGYPCETEFVRYTA
jgi:isopenicillin-N N-acyltransferase-like protein